MPGLSHNRPHLMVSRGMAERNDLLQDARVLRRGHVGHTQVYDRARTFPRGADEVLRWPGVKAKELGGKAKEVVGNVTGDARARDEGKGDQAKSNLKDAGEKVKDAFKK